MQFELGVIPELLQEFNSLQEGFEVRWEKSGSDWKKDPSGPYPENWNIISWIAENNQLEMCEHETEVSAKLFQCVLFTAHELPEFSNTLFSEMLDNTKFRDFILIQEAKCEIFSPYFDDIKDCTYLCRLGLEQLYDHHLYNEFCLFYPNFLENVLKLYEGGVWIDSVFYNITDTFLDDGTIHWKLEGLDSTLSFAYFQHILSAYHGDDEWMYVPHPYPFDSPSNPFDREFSKWRFRHPYDNY